MSINQSVYYGRSAAGMSGRVNKPATQLSVRWPTQRLNPVAQPVRHAGVQVLASKGFGTKTRKNGGKDNKKDDSIRSIKSKSTKQVSKKYDMQTIVPFSSPVSKYALRF